MGTCNPWGLRIKRNTVFVTSGIYHQRENRNDASQKRTGAEFPQKQQEDVEYQRENLDNAREYGVAITLVENDLRWGIGIHRRTTR